MKNPFFYFGKTRTITPAHRSDNTAAITLRCISHCS